jgi:hypothetical protein
MRPALLILPALLAACAGDPCVPCADDSAVPEDYVFEGFWWRVRSADVFPHEGTACDSPECVECVALMPGGTFERAIEHDGAPVHHFTIGTWELYEDYGPEGRDYVVDDDGVLVYLEVYGGIRDTWASYEGWRYLHWWDSDPLEPADTTLTLSAGCPIEGYGDEP